MLSTTEIRIPSSGVRSLAWDGPCLVDWAGGGQRYSSTAKRFRVRSDTPTLSTQQCRCQAVASQ